MCRYLCRCRSGMILACYVLRCGFDKKPLLTYGISVKGMISILDCWMPANIWLVFRFDLPSLRVWRLATATTKLPSVS
jgi:hypothetical protein